MHALVLALTLSACGGEEALPAVEGAVSLPPPALEAGLDRTLATRRSSRDFSTAPLSLPQVGQLAWAAQGQTGEEYGRTVPSAGALYPLEVYLVVERVEGLGAGLYHYAPAAHALESVRSGPLAADLRAASLDQEVVGAAAVTVVLAGVPSRTAAKYGRRAERYVLLEGGAAMQAVLLTAADLGLAAVPVGAFDDRAVARILGAEAMILMLIPVGVP